MKIDDCGAFSKNLNKILDEFVKKEKKEGKEVTQFEINAFDTALFNAYENIKSISSNNEEIISDSMAELQQLMNSGYVNISDISKIATSITEDVVKENKIKTEFDNTATTVISGVAAYNVANHTAAVVDVATVTTTALYEVDKTLIDSMCTEKMEILHKDIYNRAKNNDKEAIVELDLVKKASNFILSKDKLNAKGKEVGALVLASQLLKLNTPEAIEMAKQLVDKFEIKDVKENGNVDLKKVREKLKELKPGLNIDRIEENCEKSAIDRKDKIIATSSDSYRRDVENLVERKKILGFMQEYRKDIDSNKQNEAEKLVSCNYELAKKALYLQKRLCENAHQKGKENELFELSTKKLEEIVAKNKRIETTNKENRNDER